MLQYRCIIETTTKGERNEKHSEKVPVPVPGMCTVDSMIGCGTASAPAETVPATESVTEQAARRTVAETASAETEETAAEEAIEAAETTYPVTLTDQAGP